MSRDYTKQLTEILIALKNINDNICRRDEKSNTAINHIVTLKKEKPKSTNDNVGAEKYPQKIVEDMREIYKAVMRKVRKSGQTDEVDTLVIRLYKTKFEQNTVEKE